MSCQTALRSWRVWRKQKKKASQSTSREHGHSHRFTVHAKRFIQLDNKIIVAVDKDHDHMTI